SYEALSKILPVLEETSDWSNDALYELLKKLAEENGLKYCQILWPLRTAVSGKQMTPGGATELMEILGREESLIRIKAGIELLKDSIG
ncbi:MAG: glutamate--tRNA ligase, partial [Lachnospiraceae bacterium]|nr:glutamate--tRNA ligase [Lachnospiraceae bacterium]